MNSQSLKSLLWIAIIVLLTGMAVMSPVAGFALYVLSALFSAFPVLSGSKWVRFTGITVLALALLLSVVTYPKYAADMMTYKKRAIKAAERKPAATPDKTLKSP